ncbi:MAG: metallophosphoesterase [Desulfitobacteriaceae bacterium]|nr:metallophosphoesterase [Desulfitobacteriaceae bacterium]
MKFFAMGDLHLSFDQRVIPGCWEDMSQYKPMDIFGSHWKNHYQKIYDNWCRLVGADDVVFMPGDISWAMDLEDAKWDLDFLNSLPGKIVLVRGNHDYWWKSIARVRQALPNNIVALQNDCFIIGKTAVCGSRGWVCPGSDGFSEHDQNIYLRELKRVELSLKTVPHGITQIILMLHFMPTGENHEASGFIELMKHYQVKACVYGHLHHPAYAIRLPDHKWGIDFFLVSADYLGFTPKLLWEEK